MARARSNGGAYAWALVVLGCGFVISLLVAIIFYTKIKQAEDAQAEAETQLRTYVNLGQDTQALQPWLNNSGNSSAARALMDEVAELRSTIDFKDGQLTEALAAKQQAETLIEQTRGTVGQRDEELIRQQAQAQAALEEAQTQARTTQEQLNALTAENEELSRTLQAAMRDVNASAQTQIDQLTGQISTLTNDLNEAEDLIDQLADYSSDLEQQLRSDVVVPDVTTADGEILSVFNNGGQLFIDRGRNQGVMLGMTFDVFEDDEVIRLSNSGAVRGKATIEVYELQDDTASCRVVRTTRGAQVVPGDVIANIVYDPNKEFTFYAYGFFDIENNGGTSDINRIENMITQWGGTVAELEADEDGLPILSPQIDFLVLGQQPVYPDELDQDELDPEVIRAWQARVREYETYQTLLADAKTLRIPILNMNRFLDLVGYYVR